MKQDKPCTHGRCQKCGSVCKTTYYRYDMRKYLCDRCYPRNKQPCCADPQGLDRDPRQCQDDSTGAQHNLNHLRATAFEFRGAVGVQQALELMSNGSCGD